MSRDVAGVTITWTVPDSDHPKHEELAELSIELSTRLSAIARLARYAELWPNAGGPA